MDFFTTLPGIIISVGTILTVIVLYLIGLWKQGSNKEDDRLISILQGTVNALEEKVNKQTTDIEKLTKEVHELKKDNQKYIEIFQGRNKETEEYYKRGYIAMDTVAKLHDSMTTIAEVSKNTNEAMQKLIDIVGKIAIK